jgi:hypothetical protein
VRAAAQPAREQAHAASSRSAGRRSAWLTAQWAAGQGVRSRFGAYWAGRRERALDPPTYHGSQYVLTMPSRMSCDSSLSGVTSMKGLAPQGRDWTAPR